MKPTKDKVKCVSAKTRFYTNGEMYQLFLDEKGNKFVKGSDGFYDNLTECVSKFVEVKVRNEKT